MQKKWLQTVPWDGVIALNKSLCQAQKLEPLTQPKGFDPARRVWEAAVPRGLSLKEALDVCRECHDLAPFMFNNGNTFAGVGRTLIEEWTKSMASVDAQVLQTTICHYIAGLVGRRELLQVLKHFESVWKAQPAPAPEPAREETPRYRETVSPMLAESQPRA